MSDLIVKCGLCLAMAVVAIQVGYCVSDRIAECGVGSIDLMLSG